MNRFVLKKYIHKNIIYHFSTNIFIKISIQNYKLCFGDRITILNVIYFLYEGSIWSKHGGKEQSSIKDWMRS
jgi:hypothetical protein